MLLFNSCIGTVQDKSTNKFNAKGEQDFEVTYEGLKDAVAVSHNKIYVTFPEYTGHEEGDVLYLIFLGENSGNPIKLSTSSLTKNPQGYFYYVLTTYNGQPLRPAQTLQVRVEVEVKSISTRSNSLINITATTFRNKVADFTGIKSARLPAGNRATSTVLVDWIAPTPIGDIIFTNAYDVVAYDVSCVEKDLGLEYMWDDGYIGNQRVRTQEPASVGSSPRLTTETRREVTGLQSGVTYYCGVRALHKEWFLYESVPGYQHEKNEIYQEVTTLAEVGRPDFDSTSLRLTAAVGEAGLDTIDMNWSRPTGGFDHFRVYWQDVASLAIADQLTNDGIDAKNAIGPTAYKVLDTDTVFYALSNLSAYTFYQIKLVVCITAVCDSANRITTNAQPAVRTEPRIVPFSGLTRIQNPSSSDAADEVELVFESPVISSGYLTAMEVYCYENQTDSSPVLMPNGVTLSGTGKSNCEGLTRRTADPGSFNNFGVFTGITIDNVRIDGTQYCFSVIPIILNGAEVISRDFDNAIVKCSYPRIITPTLADFPGKNFTCNVSSGTDLEVTWNAPSGGIYENFVIFWKEKSSSSPSFSLLDAIPDFEASDNSTYQFATVASDQTSYTITNLIPGQEYFTAVLTYVEESGVYNYSEINARTSTCLLDPPVASFGEWFDVIALGPKENGLIPKGGNAAGYDHRFVPEALDEFNVPFEIDIDASDVPQNNDEAYLNTGDPGDPATFYFDGVFGGLDDGELPHHRYSNLGIVKIAWTDMQVFGGQFISQLQEQWETANNGGVPVNKPDRLFGYHVERSHDNGLSWVRLTDSSSDGNDTQTVANSGVVLAQDYQYRPRSNISPVTVSLASFTDYSVSFFEDPNNNTQRARIYKYRIIPVYNGEEIEIQGVSGQGTITVTLPPPNMALIHRWIANRTMCEEIGRTVDTTLGANYSCLYNGMGSTALSVPWQIGVAKYDLGGDLLVDRFEMGCRFTRGGLNPNDSTSSNASADFDGNNDSASPFLGCFHGSAPFSSPLYSTDDPEAGDETTYPYMLKGDCIGSGGSTSIVRSGANCAGTPRRSSIVRPGVDGNEVVDCVGGDDSNTLADPELMTNYAIHSEFAAVYAIISATDVHNEDGGADYQGPNGTIDIKNTPEAVSCFVNLPFMDGSDSDEMRPRWFSASQLFDDVTVGGDALNLGSMTVGEAKASADLFDVTNFKVPTAPSTNRFDDDDYIANLMVSNSAKLPTLGGLRQEQYSSLCSLKSVEIGYESASTFVATESAQSKRLMRKKEFTMASKWSSQYDNSKITTIEDGRIHADHVVNESCNSADRNLGSATNLAAGTGTLYTDRGGEPTVVSGSTLTRQCVSRFGIQDLVGNLWEHTSDRIFCDYSQDRLYLGETDGDVISGLDITSSWGTYFNADAGLVTWIDVGVGSGQCSVINAGAENSSDRPSVAADLATGFVDPIEVGGSWAAFIETPKSFDQESVEDLRNGDGTFLDFGVDNFLPNITTNHSLAIRNTTTIGTFSTGSVDDPRLVKYFNPVVGIPHHCDPDNTCLYSRNASFFTDDNLMFTTSDLVSLWSAKGSPIAADVTSATDFPIGNSQIYNEGISEYQVFTDRTNNNDPLDYVDSIDQGANPASGSDNTRVIATRGIGDTSPSVSLVRWTTPRNSSLLFVNGGDVDEEYSGRYTMYIRGSAETRQDNQTSARCAVKINED